MHPVRKQRLLLVLALIIGSSVIIGLVLYSARNYADFFYPVSKIVSGEAPLHKSIRAGGCVVPGTIVSAQDRLHTEFVITDGSAQVKVEYDGLLPDIFGEGEAAVVTGKLNDERVLIATQVLAKHDENYVPPEVAESMSDTERHNEACKGMNLKETSYGS
jgi:cytochrome c-type biogenesis protein CcmE